MKPASPEHKFRYISNILNIDLKISSFTRTRRTSWYGDIEVPTGAFLIVEMQPRWIDDLTLQLALSRFDYADPTTQARRMSLRRNVPDLEEALKWCAQHRMAAKIVTVPTPIEGELLERYRELQASVKTLYSHSVFDAKRLHASHRLSFKRWEDAMYFKLRW
ncbi:conserved protein of unknown function [Methylorubrum extorquens]|uniref:Uncharacterized protein n=2 Tax=Methylorubrum extorquens TaxID=408 RepID=A0A2N9AJX3_METEX|nr:MULTISPECIES: hypothetical protein [Methylobacteriaceae]WHQ69535.1 hypothetical protein KEC54_24885 [Methylorubrum extorquens]SOR27666.1 conserved protein of unknown function [Methylorubrum extorquens]